MDGCDELRKYRNEFVFPTLETLPRGKIMLTRTRVSLIYIEIKLECKKQKIQLMGWNHRLGLGYV